VIQVQCLPGDIPKSIDIDVSGLNIGDSIHIQEISVEKAKIISETNFTIATVVPPAVEEKAAEVAAPEVVEGAEVEEKKEEEQVEKK
jgi:large subunit ribosomal protein L25